MQIDILIIFLHCPSLYHTYLYLKLSHNKIENNDQHHATVIFHLKYTLFNRFFVHCSLNCTNIEMTMHKQFIEMTEQSALFPKSMGPVQRTQNK